MRLPRFLLVLPLVALLVSACERQTPEHKATIFVFGTLVEFTLRDVHPDVAEQTISDLEQDFQRMHKEWHAWKEGGELMRVNTAIANGEAVEVSDFTVDLIKAAKDYEQLSGGLFNPAIGKLIGTWGFHADEPPTGGLPDMDAIAAIAATRPSMSDIQIDGNRVRSSNPNVSLDFGGFAKGVALNWAEQKMRDAGITKAIVNAGGDLNSIGTYPGRPWRVGIKHPVEWGVLGGIELKPDENVYTSGNYQRFFEHEGVRYAHILDPKTGMPVDHIVSATVIHSDGALADAASTALTVAGPDNWVAVARSFGITLALVVDADGRIHVTPDLKDRIEFPEGESPTILVGDPS